MKVGPNVKPPPAHLVAQISARLPTFWRDFTYWVDAATGGAEVTLTSWWRSRDRNRAVGGALDSQHLYGTAVDLVLPDVAARRRAQATLRRAGFIAVDEGDHLHVQAFPAGELRRAGVTA